MMMEKSGIGIFPGIVVGRAAVFNHMVQDSVEHALADDSSAELRSFEEARESVLSSIRSLKPATDEEKAMLGVYESMLSDPDYLALIRENITERRYTASWAVEAATEKYTAALAALGDTYFAERIADIRDAESRLLSAISGIATETIITEPSIIIADYLLPSELIQMDRINVLGLLLDTGGSTSHIAILAHSDEIPTVLGLGDISGIAEDGCTVVMDGREGLAIVDPDEKTLRSFRAKKGVALRAEKELKKEASLPAITTDGVQIHLMCNIEGLEGIEGAVAAGAEGVGLFRTEFLVLKGNEDREKDHIYEEAAREMGPYGPVTFRTYDLGGDKIAEGMDKGEENPILGWRAVRFCMERKDIFRSQLISILKASAVSPSVRIMFPMISGSEELLEVLAFLEEVKAECREKGIAFDENMKIGTMIETPSAAITADILADPSHAEEKVLDVIRHTFRPEFINRIDEIVVFNPLGESEIRKIVHIQLGILAKRVERRGYRLEWSDDVEAYIAKAGFDPVYGARPIRRFIQDSVENELSTLLLSGKLTEGSTIHISMENGKISVS